MSMEHSGSGESPDIPVKEGPVRYGERYRQVRRERQWEDIDKAKRASIFALPASPPRSTRSTAATTASHLRQLR